MWAFLTPGNLCELLRLGGGSGGDLGFNCGIIKRTDGLLIGSFAKFVLISSDDSSNLFKALGEELDNAERHWYWLAMPFGL